MAKIIIALALLKVPSYGQTTNPGTLPPGIESVWVVSRMHGRNYQYIFTSSWKCKSQIKVDGLGFLDTRSNGCRETLSFGFANPMTDIVSSLILIKTKETSLSDDQVDDLISTWKNKALYTVPAGTECGTFKNADEGYKLRLMSVVTPSGVHGYAHCQEGVRKIRKPDPSIREKPN